MSFHPYVIFSVKHNVPNGFGMVFWSQMESSLAAAHDFLSEGSEDVFVVFWHALNAAWMSQLSVALCFHNWSVIYSVQSKCFLVLCILTCRYKHLRPFHDFILIIIIIIIPFLFFLFHLPLIREGWPDWECAKEYKVQKNTLSTCSSWWPSQILPATWRDVRQGGLLKHSIIIFTVYTVGFKRPHWKDLFFFIYNIIF